MCSETDPYWAHSTPGATGSRDGWQRLRVHLEECSAVARDLATLARPGDSALARWAELAGLLHDFGKYSPDFQKMLCEGEGHPQHAVHGAFVSYLEAQNGDHRPLLVHLAECIAGHHTGLHDRSAFLAKIRPPAGPPARRREVTAADAFRLAAIATADCPALGAALAAPSLGAPLLTASDQQRLDLLTRMLFSCVVDADRLNSAGRVPVQAPLAPEERLAQLQARLAKLSQRPGPAMVKEARARVLEDCLAAAGSERRLFSLNVPTGGGKTLAAMAFALRRAALFPERFRRIIVVVPFLSVIEQNAKVYEDVFGPDAVLEHHSGSLQRLRVATGATGGVDIGRWEPVNEADEDDQGPPRAETENWDAPFIVTTSVRFFESLFSNHPRDLRRVHNVARSIVILDEVQTLPRRLLAPLLDMMRELTEDWGLNFVFSTATQPAFERAPNAHGPRWEPGTVTEIVREPEPLRQTLRRAEIQWEVETPQSWTAVAERALSSAQCLTVVNLRRHARVLYAEALRQAEARGLKPGSVFHLSTRMCAAHRLRALDAIKARLADDMPCQVISTQLVEAGVDVDFPLVLRAIAPLDSIVQAAGRADREGRLTEAIGRPGGRVVVFSPEDGGMPPNEYAEAAAITQILAREAALRGASIQVDSASVMRRYFERYYSSEEALGLELAELRSGIGGKPATIAEQFAMISARMRDVFVVDSGEARRTIDELRRIGRLTADLRRRLQRHTVGLSPSEFESTRSVLEELGAGSEIWVAMEQAYHPTLGLLGEALPDTLVVSSV